MMVFQLETTIQQKEISNKTTDLTSCPIWLIGEKRGIKK